MVRKIKNSNKINTGKNTEIVASRVPFFELIQQNLVYFIAGLVVLVLLAGGFFLWKCFDNKNEAKASALFYQACQTFKKSKAQEASLEEPLKLFQTIISDYPGTSSGSLSLFYAGDCQFAMKKFDDAIASYNKFLKEVSSQPQLTILAYDSLGYCYEEKNDYKKALEYFQKTITPSPGLGETGYLNAGRCFEALGDTEGALSLYKKFLLEFPNSFRNSLIQEKIKVLELKSGKGGDVAKKPN